MRIDNITVKNYRNIDRINVVFNPKCNYIIGENNLGKSNFYLYLPLIVAEKDLMKTIFLDSEKPIEIELSIRLCPNEQGFFGDAFSPEDASLLKNTLYAGN